LTGGLDRTLRLWDIESSRQLAVVHVKTQCVQFVSLSPDGKHAVTGGGERWNVEGHHWVGDGDYALRLWRLPENFPVPRDLTDEVVVTREKLLLRGHRALALCAVYSPDGRSVLSSGGDDPLEPEMSYDKTVRLWEIATGKEVRVFLGHTKLSASVAFSPEGKSALSGGSDGTLRLWDVATGQLVRKLVGHSGWVRSVGFSPDGSLIVSGSADYGPGYGTDQRDNTLRLWDVNTGAEVWQVDVGRGVNCVAFTPDGRSVVSGGGDLALAAAMGNRTCVSGDYRRP
jgi:Tol biopolymer transport system component